MDSQPDDGIDLRAYLAVLRNRLGLASIVAAAVFAGTAVYSFTRTPVYVATARVLITPPPAAAPNLPPVNLETERLVATSQQLASAVQGELQTDTDSQTLIESLNVRQVPGAEILEFQMTWEDAQIAQEAASAFADAYVSYRNDQVEEALARAEAVLERRLTSARDQLDQIDSQMNVAGRRERNDLVERRAALLVQIGLVEQRLGDLQPETAAELTAASVLEEAALPDSPSAPNHEINLLLGAALGVLLGILVAFAHYFWTTTPSIEE